MLAGGDIYVQYFIYKFQLQLEREMCDRVFMNSGCAALEVDLQKIQLFTSLIKTLAVSY